MRDVWTALTDTQLIAQCAIDTYRASGPGGQKRNKTSSAVRVRHLPSGLIAIAEESRSQHENRERAVKRLRQMLYLELRDDRPPPNGWGNEPVVVAVRRHGKLVVTGKNDPHFWPAAARVLDAFVAYAGGLRDTAVALGVTTAPLVDFLRTHPKLWQAANEIRSRLGQGPLK